MTGKSGKSVGSNDVLNQSKYQQKKKKKKKAPGPFFLSYVLVR